EKQERKALSRLTAEYIRQLNNGSSFEEIAEMAGKKIKLTSAFKRNDKLPNISSVAIEQAFNLEVGSFSVAPTKNGMSRMIFEVVEIIPPSKTSDEEKKQLEQRLLQNLRANTVKQLMLYLRNRYGATTDQRLIDQTVGISKG
ncbi:MAG: peptidyl-prolyl cis-trans isomerase, partial [Hyphomicrobiaceae bacterium]|nr:peptidyl-prolyl cis-trans isomerase [Hyphomicrobiaceae bacterium]